MKRSKGEEKMMGPPMLPRLHVNDTDKGGPRAPPRNKMALYEKLTVPSQSFNYTAANSVPPSSQEDGIKTGMFYSHQLLPRHQSEKPYNLYSDKSTPPLTHIEKRKKSAEDDFTVPIFIDSTPSQACACRKYINDMYNEKPSYFSRTLKFQESKKTATSERSIRREGENQNKENSEDFVPSGVKDFSNSPFVEKTESPKKKNDLSLCLGLGDVDRLKTDGDIMASLCKINSSALRAFSSEDQNMERGENAVPKTSDLDFMPGLDIIPDVVIKILGQTRFWKARNAIVKQQRTFQAQIFELHRLAKVQKQLAASPHLLRADSACSSKPINKPPPREKLPLENPLKAIPNSSNQKDANTLGQASCSSIQKDANTLEQASCSSIQQYAQPWSFYQPQELYPWLFPMMTPFVYNPYTCYGSYGFNPGIMGNFPTQTYGIPQFQYPYGYFPPFVQNMNCPDFPAMGAYASIQHETLFNNTPGQKNDKALPKDVEVQASTAGIPKERVQVSKEMNCPDFQGQVSAMGIKKNNMPGQKNKEALPKDVEVQASTAGIPREKVQASKEMNCPDFPAMGARASILYQTLFNNMPGQKNKEALPKDVEVQASTAGIPREKVQVSKAMKVLPLFPTSPELREAVGPSRAIKAVPLNAVCAPEAGARILRTIQEEKYQ